MRRLLQFAARQKGLLGGASTFRNVCAVVVRASLVLRRAVLQESRGSIVLIFGISSSLCVAADILPAAHTISTVSNAIVLRQPVTVTATLMLESEPGYLFVHDDRSEERRVGKE